MSLTARFVRVVPSWMALACVVGAGMVGGCGSSEKQAAQDTTVTPAGGAAGLASFEAYEKLGYRLDWTGYATIVRNQQPRFFDVLGDLVVTQDSGGTISAMSGVTGQHRWATVPSTPQTRYLGVLRDGDRLIACSETEAFVIDAASGNVAARRRYGRVATTRPVLVGDLIVLGGGSGLISAVSYRTGLTAWQYQISGRLDTRPARLGPEGVGFVSQSGDVIMLDVGSGSSLGRAKIFDGVDAPPAATAGLMFVASRDQSIYAFERFGAAQRWRKRTDAPLPTAPVVHDGRLYVTIPSQGFTALDAETGKDLWNLADVTGVAIGLRAGRVLVWDGRDVVSVDAQRGEVVERVSLPDVAMIRTDAFADGHLYTITAAGEVRRLAPR